MFSRQMEAATCVDRKKGRDHLIGEEEQRQLIDQYRAMSPLEKVHLIDDLYRVERCLFEIGFLCLHPNAAKDDVVNGYMKVTLEPQLFAEVMAYKKQHKISA